jgi:hypothetical protein
MLTVLQKASITVDPEGKPLGEVVMVGQERWQEIHRLFREGRVPIAEISRRLDLDRKTVRRCLRRETWQPYLRPGRASQPENQRPRRLGEGRSARPAVGTAGPLPSDEFAVPAEHGLGRHEKAGQVSRAKWWLATARKSRSLHRNRGRPTCRRST